MDPTFRRILVATDGTEAGANATKTAVRLAAQTGGRVIAMHVVSPPLPDVAFTGLGMMGAPVPLDAPPGAGTDPDHALSAALDMAREQDVPLQATQVADMRPADAIVRMAERYRCDLIVMGARGRGGLAALVAGSISRAVFREVDIPVLLVH